MMEISNTWSSGLAGIRAGQQGLARNALDIARAPVAEQKGERDVMVDALIKSKENLTQVQASSKVIKAASDTIGSIIDTTA